MSEAGGRNGWIVLWERNLNGEMERSAFGPFEDVQEAADYAQAACLVEEELWAVVPLWNHRQVGKVYVLAEGWREKVEEVLEMCRAHTGITDRGTIDRIDDCLRTLRGEVG